MRQPNKGVDTIIRGRIGYTFRLFAVRRVGPITSQDKEIVPLCIQEF